jgi:hypothetical protein
MIFELWQMVKKNQNPVLPTQHQQLLFNEKPQMTRLHDTVWHYLPNKLAVVQEYDLS